MTGVFSTPFFFVVHEKAENKGTDPMKFEWGWDVVLFFGPFNPLEAPLLTSKQGRIPLSTGLMKGQGIQGRSNGWDCVPFFGSFYPLETP